MDKIVSIITLGILIALHEAGHFYAARRVGMTVKRFSVGLLRAIVSWTSKKTGIVYQIGILPLGGFVEIKGMNPFEEDAFTAKDSYQNMSIWRRYVVLLAGPVANLIVALVMFWGISVFLGLSNPADRAELGQIVPGKPAALAGLQQGDRVLTLDGKQLETWTDLTSGLQAKPGLEVELLVQRENKRSAIKVTPADEGGVGKIGVYPPVEYIRVGPLQGVKVSVLKVYQITTNTFTMLAWKISGHEKGKNLEAAGPIKIVQMASAALQTGPREFLGVMAYLSVILFLFNLFPIPALDGGRGVFLVYEAITRKKIKPKVEAAVNSVGFFLLIGLLIVISGGEIFELLTGSK